MKQFKYFPICKHVRKRHENVILSLTCNCFHFKGKSYFLEVYDLLLFSETLQGSDGALIAYRGRGSL